MNCPYEDNSFCKKLSAQTLSGLCRHCTHKKFAQGQQLSETYFSRKMILVLDGMLTKMELDPTTQKMTTSGIGSCGSLFSLGDLLPASALIPEDNRTSICVTECTVASFDIQYAHQLFDTNIEFVRNCFENTFQFCVREKAIMMRDIGRGDVYSAVRYVVKFCRDHRIAPLTHEQIAMVCSRSRPTVTSILHQLIKKEPELFQPAADAEAGKKRTD